MKQVISLMPELIKNEDGTEKQDCEINASKRWLKSSKSLNGRGYLTRWWPLCTWTIL